MVIRPFTPVQHLCMRDACTAGILVDTPGTVAVDVVSVGTSRRERRVINGCAGIRGVLQLG